MVANFQGNYKGLNHEQFHVTAENIDEAIAFAIENNFDYDDYRIVRKADNRRGMNYGKYIFIRYF